MVIAVLALVLAQEYDVEALKEGAPAEVAEAVRKEMSPAGLRVFVKDGKKPLADLWLRAATPLENAPEQLAVKYTALKPGTLVGVIRYHAKGGDYKNQSIPAGLYTLRYGIQPEDGDHQGVSETKDFLLVCPASADASPQVVAGEDLVKLSAKTLGKKHPAALWLVKPGDEKLPRISKEEEGKRWVLECDLPAVKPLRLGLVVVGKSPDF